MSRNRTAMAIAAHPDDIEFVMAGTLLQLKNAGFQIHYLNIATGSAGTLEMPAQEARIVRAREGREAAKLLGAQFHGSLADDLEVLYSTPLLRRVAAAIRIAAPDIVLTHSPSDYMEDHMNACRLAVTAAFTCGMPNFQVEPPLPPVQGDIAVYHAMPHGLRDGLRRRVHAGQYVDTTSVHALKREALAAHRSQKEWLDASQGMDSYLVAMDEMSEEVGRLSGKFKHAEGWRRHLHLGLSSKEIDPLAEALGDKCLIDDAYEASLG